MKLILAAAALALPVAATATKQETPVVEQQVALTDAEAAEAEAILQAFADDYVHDHMALSGIFAIKLGDRFWTVEVERKETPNARGRLTDHSFGPHKVLLRQGKPDTPTYVYTIASMDVLRLIGDGKVNAGTAAMQSYGSDQVGVETSVIGDFKMNSGAEAHMYQHLSHFFTTGTPEITTFDTESSLQTHGIQATALHMMKGVRVLHFHMGAGDVANADADLQKGQMPNLFVITEGTGVLFSDNGQTPLKAGMSVFVPQFVKHELRATGEGMQGIAILYGDNSDFAFGTSYPTYLEDLYRFHAEYEFRKSETAKITKD